MATMIYVDQENAVGNLPVKDRAAFSTKVSKSLGNQAHPAYPGKVFGTYEKATARKALGNVNKQVVPPKVVSTQKSNPKKLKGSLPSAKKVSVTVCPDKPDKENYPEIENCFPYNPSDFERFDVPEEHKLSNFCLAGVSLMVHENKKFEALLNMKPAPMVMPPLTWEYDALPEILDTLDPIMLDLPSEDY